MDRGRRTAEGLDGATGRPGDGATATEPKSAAVGGRRSALGIALLALGVLLLLALLALLGLGMLRRQGGSFAGFSINTVGRAAELKPRPASDFSLALFEGGTFRLSEQRGKLVVLNFWSSWCPPCREEARTLEAASRDYRDRGVLFVGVDIWDQEADARAFLRQYGVTYPNGPDQSGAITVEYGVTGIPETYFITPEGILVRRWIGPLTGAQLAGLLDELLVAKP